MKKIISLILLFSLLSCSNNYTNFHENKDNFDVNKTEIKENLSNFSLSNLREFESIEISATPDKKLLKEIVKKIDEAKARIFVEVYIFTEKDLQKALVRAKKRGIDVKVIMEKNVYKAGNLNKKTSDNFAKNNIETVWASDTNFALTHTKMMIIDDARIISTGNYSYSTFSKNREFFIFVKDEKLLGNLLNIFNADFTYKKEIIYDENLILSPYYTREKFDILLKSAKKSIKMYIQNFGDTDILEILKSKQKEGIDIEIIMPDLKALPANKEEIVELDKAGIKYKLLKSPYIHAKGILVDDKYLYLGSVNMSYYSIEKNREIGLLIKEQKIISKFNEVFSLDFKK
ncbi:MAG: phosphatidylserine/phosphatidylglycerophosphate/cardiolipin synthase family protein [Candidatus Gracilibacteria bacterium]|nr:phosphatidylserine/phosphatidylglycerophosphate/cardiolipin synthase family protein [Candidatus Gracilibacteria bacterium]